MTSYHIRMLVESEWNGGSSLTYQQVGQMTLDQIWHRLCDLEILKTKAKAEPKQKARSKLKPSEVVAQLGSSKDGFVKGRDKDGKPMKAKIRGKSLARQLMEEEAKREVEEEKQRAKQKRREKRERRRLAMEEARKRNGI